MKPLMLVKSMLVLSELKMNGEMNIAQLLTILFVNVTLLLLIVKDIGTVLIFITLLLMSGISITLMVMLNLTTKIISIQNI